MRCRENGSRDATVPNKGKRVDPSVSSEWKVKWLLLVKILDRYIDRQGHQETDIQTQGEKIN